MSKKMTVPKMISLEMPDCEPEGKTGTAALRYSHQTAQYFVGYDDQGTQRWLPKSCTKLLGLNSITDIMVVRAPLKALEQRGLC